MISVVERLKDVNLNTKMSNFWREDQSAVILNAARGKKEATPILESSTHCSKMDFSGNLQLFIHELKISLAICLLACHPQQEKETFTVISV